MTGISAKVKLFTVLQEVVDSGLEVRNGSVAVWDSVIDFDVVECLLQACGQAVADVCLDRTAFNAREGIRHDVEAMLLPVDGALLAELLQLVAKAFG